MGTPDARVTGVVGNIVSIEATSPIMKNEVAYVCVGAERLAAEVLRLNGHCADLQVFEETQGIRAGDPVELTKQMLAATLGPGLLGRIYDGLQNPLHDLAARDGYFLRRGAALPALDADAEWHFEPLRSPGDPVRAGDVIGSVPERKVTHKIMAPFDLSKEWTLEWIASGSKRAGEVIARLVDERSRRRELTMLQSWPVRRPLPTMLLRRRACERLLPTTPLATTIRIIDTFFPIARGGTACIPGPFGAGKTVLQGLIARYAALDVVIVVACGERAGEVVDTIEEFSTLDDPRTGGKLIDRTIIICNTSSMPVAAREASIYMGVTLGEYYRQMGLDVLLIADSTSRWAQAMRETSGRLEEIPGEDAYPAYLDSAIKNVYERAGVLRCVDGAEGSLTMIGTVSPAGGNLEEPVTQATLGAVKCFLGLSSERAYKRFYPAIDPLLSWSRYPDQLRPYYDAHRDPSWNEVVTDLAALVERGEAIYQMMQVTGEEGVSLDDFVLHEKSRLLDMAYLQQDAFDPIDVSTSPERQKEALLLMKRLTDREYRFTHRDQARLFFTRLTGLCKNLNYAPYNSRQYQAFLEKIVELEEQAVVGEFDETAR